MFTYHENMKAGVTYSNSKKLDSYCEALRIVGVEPVPLLAGGTYSLDGLAGLLISGGPDLDPAMYGEKPDGSEEPAPERDAMESDLLRQALDRDLPVLCICRGLQLFNVVHGGSLHQHLASTGTHRQKEAFDAHTVTVVEGTRLAAAMGAREFPVNSRHHQGVKKLGEGLVVSAWAQDGLEEGLERADRRFAVSVQWHPEDRIALSAHDRRLFEAFAREVGQTS
jgi:putative glutamine amidotransferase